MGNKKGPLSKAETFYIDEHVKSGKDIHEIANDLDRAISSIEKRVAKAQKENGSNRLTAGNQFARKSGSVIMTENASTLGDASRKRTKKQISACVTKIKQDE